MAAYSGGPDSTALLHLLAELADELGIEVGAAHLHHGLRGAEADADLEHCRGTCGRLGIPLHHARIKIEKAGRSMQGAARAAREAFLERVAGEHGYNKAATGHTADDVIETLIFRISRGTGVHGLAGIPARRGIFVRPLLGFRRERIIEYLDRRGIKYRVDSSNRDLRYTRNRIRHAVLPMLYEQLGPGLASALLRLSDLAAEEDSALDQWAEEAADEILKVVPEGEVVLIDEAALSELPKAVRARVLTRAMRCAASFEVTSRHVEMCESVLGRGRPVRRAALPGGVTIRRAGSIAWIGPEDAPGPIPRPFEPVNVKIPGSTELPDGWGRVEIEAASASVNHGLLLDPARLRGALMARPYRFGDRYIPKGASAEIKVKRLFGRFRVPVEERMRCVMLVDDDGILAGRGLPVAARCAPSQDCEKALLVIFR